MDVRILSPYYLDERADHDAYGLEQSADRVVDVALPGDATQQARVAAICEALATEVTDVLVKGGRPVALTGDCCAAVGVLAGLQRTGIDPTLIWFDAHGDFNTWETTPSGFLGGMPLAMIVGRGEQTLLDAAVAMPLAEERVILSDARDLDPAEGDLVRASAIHHLSPVEALTKPGAIPDGPLYIHFDSDVLDPAEAPAMNYPAPGGPSSVVMHDVFSALAQTGRIAAVSVSLWQPRLDADGRTRCVTLDLLNTLLSGQA